MVWVHLRYLKGDQEILPPENFPETLEFHCHEEQLQAQLEDIVNHSLLAYGPQLPNGVSVDFATSLQPQPTVH